MFSSQISTRVLENRCYVTKVNKGDEKRGMITTFQGLLIKEVNISYSLLILKYETLSFNLAIVITI